MTKVLNYSITGLEDYTISFDSYCSPCDIQQYCEHGKHKAFTITIKCSDLNKAKEKVKFDQLQKLQKKEDVSVSYEELIKKVKINLQNIFSQIWKEKIKTQKEILRCMDSRKRDPILVAQQGQDWWQDFNITMKEINQECEKI
ncbi:MAG: hypothetical protein ACFFBZ_08665 [Promethearchaeota archaeon]